MTLDIDHPRIGDLIVTLISPDGTESVLINRPGKAPDDAFDEGDNEQAGINFITMSTHFRERGPKVIGLCGLKMRMVRRWVY